MKLYSLVTILAILYILYYIVAKYLLNVFTLKEIIVTYYIISAFIVLIFLKDDLVSSVKKINYKFIFLIILASIGVACTCFEIIAVDSKINIGIIESLANAIYLPLIALIGFYFYKAKLSKLNLIGIILIAIGSCFVMNIE
tara:strand:+ start:6025 stop:6447 length:423 start_codon:yes stop_codon:yes gene_type:complete